MCKPYFDPTSKVDNWGAPDKVKFESVYELKRLRERLGLPIIVTSAHREGSEFRDSEHPKGSAIDIVVPKWKHGVFNLAIEALRFNFRGIGIYRDWEHEGIKIGELHFDRRETEVRALWTCWKELGRQVYGAFDQKTLQEKGFLGRSLTE